MRLLAIDPGKKFLAYAIFEDGRLVEVDGIEAEKLSHLAMRISFKFRPMAEDFDELVVEFPQVYRQTQQKGDPNDLLFLSMVSGFVIQELFLTPQIDLPSPKIWKGTVPKSIHNERILSQLDEAESALFDQTKVPTGKRHNLIDAVGIGLWKLNKLKARTP